MSDTPDLSKIVSLIMQNPSLIEQISALSRQSESTEEKAEKADTPPTDTAEPIAKEVSAAPLMRTHRQDLLNAMKPYLSENRRVAIDSMSSILDVIDVMIRK